MRAVAPPPVYTRVSSWTASRRRRSRSRVDLLGLLEEGAHRHGERAAQLAFAQPTHDGPGDPGPQGGEQVVDPATFVFGQVVAQAGKRDDWSRTPLIQ